MLVGDHVVFKIANNINAAKAAEALGTRVSRLVGEIPSPQTVRSPGILMWRTHL